jgi:hypothetical protein
MKWFMKWFKKYSISRVVNYAVLIMSVVLLIVISNPLL